MISLHFLGVLGGSIVFVFFCVFCAYAKPLLKSSETFGSYSDGMAFCMAAVITEQSAEIVSFQRLQPNHPPTQKVNSAPCSRVPAGQFGGNDAQTVNLVKFANEGSPLGRILFRIYSSLEYAYP
jgi:hypothetical protein